MKAVVNGEISSVEDLQEYVGGQIDPVRPSTLDAVRPPHQKSLGRLDELVAPGPLPVAVVVVRILLVEG